jgi:hypothetical protein
VSESHAIIQDLQVSLSRAQQDLKYWERESSRWQQVAERYFTMWYEDLHDAPITQEVIDHEMSLIYKEIFEDN